MSFQISPENSPIRKPKILYLKISEQTLSDVPGINPSNIGELLDIKESPALRPLELNHKLFISGVKCYILMDQGTSSTAASFCNILQFNGVAKLVGEPLMHNALKYGEIICPARRFPNESFPGNIVEASISTVESNEYTKAVDGILMPDIIIPYVAKEYMSGDDSILSKLLLNKISGWNLN